MIHSLTGILKKKTHTSCTIGISAPNYGEIAFDIRIPVTTFEKLGSVNDVTTLFIYPYLSRDNLVLYGFYTEEDRELFSNMIELPGIGPGVALRILSGFTSNELRKALLENPVETLMQIKGLGKNRAERVAFELRRIIKDIPAEELVLGAVENKDNRKAVDALVVLGFKESEAKDAVKKAYTTLGDKVSVEEVIRYVLRGGGERSSSS